MWASRAPGLVAASIGADCEPPETAIHSREVLDFELARHVVLRDYLADDCEDFRRAQVFGSSPKIGSKHQVGQNRPRAALSYGYEFLEKFVQLPFRLREWARTTRRRSLIRSSEKHHNRAVARPPAILRDVVAHRQPFGEQAKRSHRRSRLGAILELALRRLRTRRGCGRRLLRVRL